MTLLMFDNPRVERAFRRVVGNTDEELGGFFVVSHEPLSWPGRFSYRALRNAVRRRGLQGAVLFISQVILIPNEQEGDDRQWHWSSWDFGKSKALADASAKLLPWSRALDFHTHPGGDCEPSEADLLFAGAHCLMSPGWARLCIVVPRPFAMCVHDLFFGATGQPDRHCEHHRGEFVSWYWREIRALREGVGS
jgi:hypothetical protein